MKRSVIPAIASGTFAAFRQAILSNRSYRDARPCTTDSPSLPISRAQPCRFLRSQMKACNWPRSIRRRTCCGKCAPSERNAGSRRRPAPGRARKAAGERLLRQRLRGLRVRPVRGADAALPRTTGEMEGTASGRGVALHPNRILQERAPLGAAMAAMSLSAEKAIAAMAAPTGHAPAGLRRLVWAQKRGVIFSRGQ